MNGPNRNGTCYTSEECEEKGGKGEGNCAMGFGTCCVFTQDVCGTDVEQNCTYIRNENYPAAVTAAGNCKYTIKKCDPLVCTVRLDFENFIINSWASTATLDAVFVCLDTFTVSGLNTGQVVPQLCGNNVGQHMYLELGTESSDTATMEFVFGATAFNRNYEIKVTQILCESGSRPPEGCLQYHVGTEGRLTTFNWAGADGHLQNQFYSICLRKEQGFCCTRYSVCSGETLGMSLYLSEASAAAVAQHDSLCTLDYLTIEGSSQSCNLNLNANRYCGNSLSDSITAMASDSICDCTGPFIVGIKTDALADHASADLVSRGVCLDYVQEPCSATRTN